MCYEICCRKVKIHFEFTNGSKKTVEAKIGTNLLDVVLDYDVDIDGFGRYLYYSVSVFYS